MRKALVIFNLFLAGIVMGQTQKGSFMAEFDGFFQHYSYGGQSGWVGGSNIGLGYAFFNNFFIGVRYNPYYAVVPDSRSNLNLAGYGMFSRYYFLKNKNKLFLQTDFTHHYEGAFGWNDKWNVGVGIDHFVSKNVAVEAYYDYNFYNRLVYYAAFGSSEIPKIVNTNKPERGTLNFGVKFFLPYGDEKTDKQNRPALSERYLKKGNRNIELYGKMGFDLPDFGYLITASKSRFITDRLALQHRLLGYGTIDFGGWIRQFSDYNIGLKPYIPISRKSYFSPSLNIGPTFYSNNEYGSKYWGWSGEAQLAFTHFFKTWKVELGANGYVQSDFKDKFGNYNILYAFAASEIFVTEKLAIKPIIYYNLMKETIGLNQFQYDRFVEVQDFRLQFGISYFY